MLQFVYYYLKYYNNFSKKNTHHLNGSKVLFPPEELLVLGSKGGHKVVTVHNDMDEGVEKTEETGVAAGGEFNPEPYGHRHDPVMYYVEGRYVIELFSHHEKELKNLNVI